MNMQAQALVLDFGGVISRTLFETHDVTERALGLVPGTLTWRGPFDEASDLLWQAMSRGDLSERDYWMARTREVGQLVGEDWTAMETFVRRARGAEPETIVRPEAERAIRNAAAAGIRLAILSNELDLFYGETLRARLPLLALFDTIVDATYTRILKPDRRAYAEVTKRLGVPAAACVFVDDQLRNVQGGKAAGMRCVHFDVRAAAAGFDQAMKLLEVSHV